MRGRGRGERGRRPASPSARARPPGRRATRRCRTTAAPQLKTCTASPKDTSTATQLAARGRGRRRGRAPRRRSPAASAPRRRRPRAGSRRRPARSAAARPPRRRAPRRPRRRPRCRPRAGCARRPPPSADARPPPCRRGRDRFTTGSSQRGARSVARKRLRRVAQDGEARVGHVEHAVGDQGAQRRQALVGQHLVQRAAIAAEHDGVQAPDGRHAARARRRRPPPAAPRAPRPRGGARSAPSSSRPCDGGRARAGCRPSSRARVSPVKTPAAWPPRRTSSTPTVRSRRTWSSSGPGSYPARSPRTAASSGGNGGSHTTRSPSAPTKATSRSPTDVHATFSWRSAQRSSQRSRRAGGSS